MDVAPVRQLLVVEQAAVSNDEADREEARYRYFFSSGLDLDPKFFIGSGQGRGSGFVSGLDPDSVTLWIRIRIGNPDPGARQIRNYSGKCIFLVIKKKFYQ
jgi:hypothetical protein